MIVIAVPLHETEADNIVRLKHAHSRPRGIGGQHQVAEAVPGAVGGLGRRHPRRVHHVEPLGEEAAHDVALALQGLGTDHAPAARATAAVRSVELLSGWLSVAREAD